jgi:type II secretory pathway pseudopilin PulG
MIAKLLVCLLIVGGLSATAAEVYQPLFGEATTAAAAQTAINVDAQATDAAAFGQTAASAIDPSAGTTYELATFATLPASGDATITEISPTQYTITDTALGSTVCLTSSGEFAVYGSVAQGAC